MPSNEDIKKVYRDSEKNLPSRKCHRGKQPNQKLKPYIVLQYLLKYTDADHVASAFDIIAFLQERGIDSDRRSIYNDVKEINYVYWLMENEGDIEEAKEVIKGDEFGDEKLILYDNKKKGFYARPTKYELSDIALLAECVYATKFISGADEARLIGVIGDLVSEHQSEQILHQTFTVGRVKSANKHTLKNVYTINYAMSTEFEGEKHEPQKVSFSYLTHEVGDVEKLSERKKKYIVSPYQLIINDGNYYLLAFDDDKKAMRTYRVDRMKSVSIVDEPREGAKEFKAIDMKTYTQRVFSMFGGELKRITLKCINPLLDTMIDRFGTKNAQYTRADASHFRVTVEVEVSEQFFSWVCGFGKRVKIETPEVAEQYKAFLAKIGEMY
jgi:hypothetical protein